ncbi:hypothetical protein [Mycolicibacterium insubricum]|nr:hypothetical protein [Mycolicibacterium insubricum]
MLVPDTGGLPATIAGEPAAAGGAGLGATGPPGFLAAMLVPD